MSLHAENRMRLPLSVSGAHPLFLIFLWIAVATIVGCSEKKENKDIVSHNKELKDVSSVAKMYLDGIKTHAFKDKTEIMTLDHNPSESEKIAICNILETKSTAIASQHGGCRTVEIRGEYMNLNCDSALVIYTKEYNDGEMVLDSLHLVKRGDQWKILLSIQ